MLVIIAILIDVQAYATYTIKGYNQTRAPNGKTVQMTGSADTRLKYKQQETNMYLSIF